MFSRTQNPFLLLIPDDISYRKSCLASKIVSWLAKIDDDAAALHSMLIRAHSLFVRVCCRS